MNRMKVRDPDHWRECAVSARDEAKRASDPEEPRLGLLVAETCESFANEIEGACRPAPAFLGYFLRSVLG